MLFNFNQTAVALLWFFIGIVTGSVVIYLILNGYINIASIIIGIIAGVIIAVLISVTLYISSFFYNSGTK